MKNAFTILLLFTSSLGFSKGLSLIKIGNQIWSLQFVYTRDWNYMKNINEKFKRRATHPQKSTNRLINSNII